MGVWGTELYSNDFTNDVKDKYLSFLKSDNSSKIALKKTLEYFNEYLNSDLEPLLWYAIADTQWNYDELFEEIKNKVVLLINKRQGVELWEENKDLQKQWENTLETLKLQLLSTPPKKKLKKVAKHDFVSNPWEIGDIYYHQIKSDFNGECKKNGSYLILQKIGNIESYNRRMLSVIRIFNRIFDFIPSIREIINTPILPLDNPSRFFSSDPDDKVLPLTEYAIMLCNEDNVFSIESFEYIGNSPYNNNPLEYDYNAEFEWYNFEEWVLDFYSEWKGFEYKYVDGKCIVLKKNDL